MLFTVLQPTAQHLEDDLNLSPNCNNNNDSYTNLSHTFKCPFVYGANEAKNHLAGSYNFTVEEYEVYSLK